MTLIFFFFWGGGGGEEVRWKTVRTYGKILATPLSGEYCRKSNHAVIPRFGLRPSLGQSYLNKGGRFCKKTPSGRVKGAGLLLELAT